MKKLKTFNYSNSYIESKISEVIGIKTKRMVYDEDGQDIIIGMIKIITKL